MLQLLAQGFTNRRIGEQLGISEHTAKFHVNAILGKLGAQTRGEAIAHAARLGSFFSSPPRSPCHLPERAGPP